MRSTAGRYRPSITLPRALYGLLGKVYLERLGNEGAMAGYGGVHIGPWKETDMLSGDQEVVHPITCMYNFLVSTKEPLSRKGGQPGSFALLGNCMGGKLPPGIHVSEWSRLEQLVNKHDF